MHCVPSTPLTRNELVSAYQSGRRDFRRACLVGLDLSSTVLSGADFSGATCVGANLSHCQLNETVFTGAKLDRSFLDNCDLTRASLRDAQLRGACLRNAMLGAADVTGALLAQTDVTGCVLTGATLSGATLTGVDLRSASLDEIRDDLRRYLALVPLETTDLLYLLWAGRFDGARSEQGEVCLAGTYEHLLRARMAAWPDNRLRASFELTMRERLQELRSWREVTSARERWCSALRPGMTPDNSQIVSITAEWVERWLRDHQPRWMSQVDAEIRHGWRQDWKNAAMHLS